jgi:hypothetical protein
MSSFLRKYATATASGTHVGIPMVKAGSNDFAVAADWTVADSFDVRPRSSLDDGVRRMKGQPEFFRKASLVHASLSIAIAYLSHLLIGQLRTVVGFALRPVVAGLPAFLVHVVRIVFGRSDEEMGRIAARWVIASVEDEHPFRYRAEREFVCDPVGTQDFIPFRPCLPIAEFVGVTLPLPAFVGSPTLDATPERIAVFEHGKPMASTERHGLAADIASTLIRKLRQRRLLAASAMTISEWQLPSIFGHGDFSVRVKKP